MHYPARGMHIFGREIHLPAVVIRSEVKGRLSEIKTSDFGLRKMHYEQGGISSRSVVTHDKRSGMHFWRKNELPRGWI